MGTSRTFLGAALTLLTLLLAAFFGFVGYMKAFAPLDMLERHNAWTVHIAEPAGRAVGWSEMACALVLAAALIRPKWSRTGMLAAAILVLNQLDAAAVHFRQGETATLPQNAVIVAASLLVLLLHARRPFRSTTNNETTKGRDL